jgi:hypothetical protein
MRSFLIFILLLAPSLAIAQGKTRLPDPLKVAAERGGAIRRPATASILGPEPLWKKIQAAKAADLRYAKALADSVGSPGAKLRSACYGAWIVTIEQTQGVDMKDASGSLPSPPEPHVFSSFEQFSEIADALQPTGPLMVACAPAWTALKLTALQFFTLAVSGAVGLSALGIAIP